MAHALESLAAAAAAADRGVRLLQEQAHAVHADAERVEGALRALQDDAEAIESRLRAGVERWNRAVGAGAHGLEEAQQRAEVALERLRAWQSHAEEQLAAGVHGVEDGLRALGEGMEGARSLLGAATQEAGQVLGRLREGLEQIEGGVKAGVAQLSAHGAALEQAAAAARGHVEEQVAGLQSAFEGARSTAERQLEEAGRSLGGLQADLAHGLERLGTESIAAPLDTLASDIRSQVNERLRAEVDRAVHAAAGSFQEVARSLVGTSGEHAGVRTQIEDAVRNLKDLVERLPEMAGEVLRHAATLGVPIP